MANSTFFNSLITKGGLTKLSRKSLIDIGITTVLVDGCLIGGVTLASLLVTGGISEPLFLATATLSSYAGFRLGLSATNEAYAHDLRSRNLKSRMRIETLLHHPTLELLKSSQLPIHDRIRELPNLNSNPYALAVAYTQLQDILSKLRIEKSIQAQQISKFEALAVNIDPYFTQDPPTRFDDGNLELKIKSIMNEINDDPEWGYEQFALMAQGIVAKSWGPVSIFRRMKNASHGEGLKHSLSGVPVDTIFDLGVTGVKNIKTRLRERRRG